MKKAALIPGIKSEPGGKHFATMAAPYLEALGFEVRIYDQIYRDWYNARWRSPKLAQYIIDDGWIDNETVVITHSDGCRVYWLADRLGLESGGAVFVQPSLDREKVPQLCDFLHIYYNPKDWIVRLAKYRPFSSWGNMGQYGPDPAYTDDSVKVFNTMATPGLPEFIEHIHHDEDNFNQFMWFVLKQIEDEL